MAISKEKILLTGVLLAGLISAASLYPAIARHNASGSEQLLSQVNVEEDEDVFTGEILDIDGERVTVLLTNGETREIVVPLYEIERLMLVPERRITAEVDAQGRATEVEWAQVQSSPAAPEGAVVEAVPETPAPTAPVEPAAPEGTVVEAVPETPAPTAPVEPAAPEGTVVEAVPETPAPTAPVEQLDEQPRPVRALW
jgi:hypothetical protein